MTRVIHTGDTHLGYQQYHVPERRADFLSAFERVIEDAVDEEVDAVVHAGDLFHDRRPTLSDVLGTLDVLRTLADADIPFLAVVGNHEAKRDAQWLDLFESLGLATRLDDEPETVGNTAFYGLDFVPRSRRDDLEYDFAAHEAEHAALVTHGLFQPFDYGDWDAGEVLSESSVSFDAMLLGDNHDPGQKQVEGAWVTYCGSTERASADERADRGYNVVTFEGEVGISRRGLDTREFVFVEVDLAAGEGLERVRERVGEHDLSEAVVIVHVDGEGEPIPPAGVEEYALEEGALVARVTDHREFEADREADVSFADPDDAVRERIRELGLSQAARDIDETVRASKVADSNVADRVEDAVRDLVEEGDPDLFEGAPAEPEADEERVDETGEESVEETEADGGRPGNATPAESDGDATPAESDGDATPAESDGDATSAEANGDSGTDTDDQSTMGEYL
ncbi:MAG: DNA double-strand break repair protein Mre11 [Haloarculaceae archaeon]